MLINLPDEIGEKVLKENPEAIQTYAWEEACNEEAIGILDELEEEGDITRKEYLKLKERLLYHVYEEIDTYDVYDQISLLIEEELNDIRGY